MTARTVARTLLAAGALSLFGAVQPACATTEVASYASGLEAYLAVTNVVTASIGELAFAGNTSPPEVAYTVANGLPGSYGYTSNVGKESFALSTGAVADIASGQFSPLSGSATSTLGPLSASFSVSGISGPALKITAASISSTSTVSDTSGLVFSGSNTIKNLDISGYAIGQDIALSTNALTPNDVLYNAGGLAIVANYQTPYFDLAKAAGVQTSALTLIFNNFVFGTGVLSGYMKIGNSTVAILDAPSFAAPRRPSFLPAAVPEPGTWAMIIIGLGLTGAAMRRQKSRDRKLASLPLSSSGS